MRNCLENQRGAVFVHVAVALLGLIALNAFVFDYGVMWVGRREAQNAADAAAHAAAVALAFNDFNDRSDTGPAKQSALSTAAINFVWGQAPSVTAADVTFPACPDGSGNGCVRVDAYRGAVRGNPLPVYFGPFAGVASQNIRATATAEVMPANATDCLKPWAVADKWFENRPTPLTPEQFDLQYDTLTFDRYDKNYELLPTPPNNDQYVAPTETDPGSGFHPFELDGTTYTADYGMQFRLKLGDKSDFQYAAGWFAALALGTSRGGNDYRNNIRGCYGATYKIGDEVQWDTEPGKMVGPTKQGVEDLVALDPTAYWDTSLNGGRGGVHTDYPGGISPRIGSVPLFNPDAMILAAKNGRTGVTITNIMGFFIEGMDGNDVMGRIMMKPDLMVAGGPPVGPAAFLRAIVLVR